MQSGHCIGVSRRSAEQLWVKNLTKVLSRRGGFEPRTFRLQGNDATTTPPRPIVDHHQTLCPYLSTSILRNALSSARVKVLRTKSPVIFQLPQETPKYVVTTIAALVWQAQQCHAHAVQRVKEFVHAFVYLGLRPLLPSNPKKSLYHRKWDHVVFHLDTTNDYRRNWLLNRQQFGSLSVGLYVKLMRKIQVVARIRCGTCICVQTLTVQLHNCFELLESRQLVFSDVYWEWNKYIAFKTVCDLAIHLDYLALGWTPGVCSLRTFPQLSTPSKNVSARWKSS
jgi:hypothetical protein